MFISSRIWVTSIFSLVDQSLLENVVVANLLVYLVSLEVHIYVGN